jgi:hypothetical protein
MPIEHADHNPYASPDSELSGAGHSRNTAATITRARYWLILVPLNAVVGILASYEWIRSPGHLVAMIAGIATVGTPFAYLEMMLRRQGRHFTADLFFYGAMFRIPCQIFLIADMAAGYVAAKLLQINVLTLTGKLPPIGGHTSLTVAEVYLMTLIVGVQLACMAVMVGIFPATIAWIKRDRDANR